MKKISIAICTDENYALNGAMAIYSASKNIAEDTRIDAYILDSGIRTVTRKRFERILRRPNIELFWLKPNLDAIDHLPISPWTTKAANARLILPELLSDKTDKVLYLDSDMLVIGDVSELLDYPLEGKCLLACLDGKYPTVQCSRASKVLTEMGLNPQTPYFNSGLLMINVKRWENMETTKRMAKLLEEKGVFFTHKDQDGLNFILQEEWGQLDNSWNVCTSRFDSDDQNDRRITQEAKIIHFTGKPPGLIGCRHPKRELFYKYVKDSNWFSNIEFFLWRTNLEIRDSVYFSIKRVRSLVRNKK